MWVITSGQRTTAVVRVAGTHLGYRIEGSGSASVEIDWEIAGEIGRDQRLHNFMETHRAQRRSLRTLESTEATPPLEYRENTICERLICGKGRVGDLPGKADIYAINFNRARGAFAQNPPIGLLLEDQLDRR